MSFFWLGGQGGKSARARTQVHRNRQHLLRRSVALAVERLEPRFMLHAAIFHTDPGAVEGDHHDEAADVSSGDMGVFPPMEAPLGATTPSGGTSSGSLVALSAIPVLNSLPGAAASLYLDFDGHYEATWGGYSRITTPAYDQDGNPGSFSASEIASITEIWQRVSEDFAPFNINVTTVQPASFANRVALRVSIGGDGSWIGPYGGVAYVSSFTNYIVNTVYVFSDNLGDYARYVAEAASHESGHAFGLNHQSSYSGTRKLDEYNPGTSSWAPIMGNSYSAARSIWYNGASSIAYNNLQSDMEIIGGATNGFGFRPDEAGNTAAAATPLTRSGTQLSGSGIITGVLDAADYFSFTTNGGNVSFTVSVAAVGPNLDARLELYNASGQLIIAVDPSTSFGATLSTSVAAGTYYLAVKASSGYGSAGQYTLAGSASASTNTSPTISINDVALTEGGYGYKYATFTVQLSRASTQTVTVNYATANGGALASSDFVSTGGTLIFAPGVISRTISVQIRGDTTFEPNEVFYVNLSGASGATLSDSQGQGTILNDDPLSSGTSLLSRAALAASSLGGMAASTALRGPTSDNQSTLTAPAWSRTLQEPYFSVTVARWHEALLSAGARQSARSQSIEQVDHFFAALAARLDQLQDADGESCLEGLTARWFCLEDALRNSLGLGT